jgi:hypothetical protein
MGTVRFSERQNRKKSGDWSNDSKPERLRWGELVGVFLSLAGFSVEVVQNKCHHDKNSNCKVPKPHPLHQTPPSFWAFRLNLRAAHNTTPYKKIPITNILG